MNIVEIDIYDKVENAKFIDVSQISDSGMKQIKEDGFVKIEKSHPSKLARFYIDIEFDFTKRYSNDWVELLSQIKYFIRDELRDKKLNELLYENI